MWILRLFSVDLFCAGQSPSHICMQRTPRLKRNFGPHTMLGHALSAEDLSTASHWPQELHHEVAGENRRWLASLLWPSSMYTETEREILRKSETKCAYL